MYSNFYKYIFSNYEILNKKGNFIEKLHICVMISLILFTSISTIPLGLSSQW